MFKLKNIFLFCLITGVLGSETSDAFISSGLVPSIIATAPENLLVVQYPNATASLGNRLTQFQTFTKPNLIYNADPGSYYTMLMIDPDAPLPSIFLQWGIGNIQSNNIARGTELAAYIPPNACPPPKPHRYFFALYKQPGKLQFDLADFVKSEVGVEFDLNGFVKKHNLTGPVYGNYFNGYTAVPLISGF